ncbi:13381_t:CDS:1 [Ambispora leptoticha]|uniref:13381_t:CDS:1 n=1 Tax=Ambispora leptoticha TaxID=144679 RepID=A0A9N9BYP4_9GLOM|nr:13381_t:CDS:1 [Ambispora leptoticha]
MLRRNLTCLELRQDDIDSIERLREEYQKNLATKRTQEIGKGKRKSVELEGMGDGMDVNDSVEVDGELMLTEEQNLQQQTSNVAERSQSPIVGSEITKNKRKNMTIAERIGL